MYDMSEKFTNWLNTMMSERGWNQTETANKSDLSRTTISDFLAGTAPIGFEACNKLAKAFNAYSPDVFRIAGLIPNIPQKNAETERMLFMLDRLSDKDRQTILDMMEFLLRK